MPCYLSDEVYIIRCSARQLLTYPLKSVHSLRSLHSFTEFDVFLLYHTMFHAVYIFQSYRLGLFYLEIALAVSAFSALSDRILYGTKSYV